MKKKLLITGAAGYVGKYMVQALKNDYDLELCDVQLSNDLFDIHTLAGADVLHLAAQTTVQDSFSNPQGYYYTNILGTAHLARLCMQEGQKLYYFSSAAALFPESSPYARSKAQAQALVESLSPLLKSVIFIPFNIYSDDPKPGTVLHHFIYDEELRVTGNGQQVRDFLHITDVINIVKAAIKDDWHTQTIELGTGQPTQIGAVAELFARYTGKEIIHVPQVAEVRESLANTRTLTKLYKGKLETNLAHDIKRMTIYN